MTTQPDSGETVPVPCLFYEGLCGVVRSTQGRRLYHFDCVEQVVRESINAADVVRRSRDFGHGGNIDGDEHGRGQS